MKYKRTNYCADLRYSDIGKEVCVCGWVQRQRDLGKLIFIDLRDRTGIIQLAFDDTTEKEIFSKAFSIRAEYVILAKGVVRERSSKNKEIVTGDIEIDVNYLEILSKSETPPFEIVEGSNVNEELRLKYRYLDLRRSDVQSKIILRHKITKTARDYFDNHGFIEIETPILIKSTPEGARDYLVPSRVFNGKFFALPQSPQLYKQLTMLAGFDRYMQIARCFRDEDLRADRQPEFTQIDLEMSFVESEDVMNMIEGFMVKVYKDILSVDLETPFKRMTYKEAMNRYGSDKPDLRFGIELVDITDVIKDTEFRVFSSAVKNGGSVRGINVKSAAKLIGRKEIDKLSDFVKDYGAKGVAFTKINDDGSTSSSFEKFLSDKEIKLIRETMGAQNGDLLLIIASDDNNIVYDSLGALRCEMARRLDLIDTSKPNLLWITDFPLFEYDKEENRYVAKHHPFTHPKDEDINKLETDPASVCAKAYDLILNGNEVGGGSIRINDLDLQNKMFKALGFKQEDIDEKFGFLVNAFKYGAPPHGGFAFGLDRLVMLMLGCDSIRDVIAFPKVASSAEIMTDSPNKVEDSQIRELGIKIIDNNE